MIWIYLSCMLLKLQPHQTTCIGQQQLCTHSTTLNISESSYYGFMSQLTHNEVISHTSLYGQSTAVVLEIFLLSYLLTTVNKKQNYTRTKMIKNRKRCRPGYGKHKTRKSWLSRLLWHPARSGNAVGQLWQHRSSARGWTF